MDELTVDKRPSRFILFPLCLALAVCLCFTSTSFSQLAIRHPFIGINPGDTKSQVNTLLDSIGAQRFTFNEFITDRGGLGANDVWVDSFWYGGVFVFFDEHDLVRQISLLRHTPWDCDETLDLYLPLMQQGQHKGSITNDTSRALWSRYGNADVTLFADCVETKVVIEITAVGQKSRIGEFKQKRKKRRE